MQHDFGNLGRAHVTVRLASFRMVLAVAGGLPPWAPATLMSWSYCFAFVICGLTLCSWSMARACLDSGVPFVI